VRLEVLMGVTMKITVVWDVTPRSLVDRYQHAKVENTEDGGSRFLQNTDTYLSNYKVSHPGRQ
jgi:hypothetical protein